MKVSTFTKMFIFFLGVTLFLGVGYASISAIPLEVNGTAQLDHQTGIFITQAEYASGTGVDSSLSNIITFYQTMLNSKVVLSSSNSGSSITYTISIYNDLDASYAFQGIEYDPSFYDNQDIEVVTNGLNIGDTIDSKETKTFTITFQYRSGVTPSSSNNVLNSYINFKFEEAQWYDLCDANSTNLKCRFIAMNTAQSDDSLNFSAFSSATNGRGLYYTSDPNMTEDLDGDGVGEKVFYFRGNVTNNFVRFDSYCWRIVRTNEDGSIRLIYGGTPNNQGNCPQSGSTASIGNSVYNNYGTNTYDNAYMGYMYGARGQNSYAATHRNSTNSTIKTTVDNWYNNNLSDSASYLADYRFCNDRELATGNGYGTNASEYAPQVRFYGNQNSGNPQTPTLKCNQANDQFSVDAANGNGALTYPIGLLTADEADLAGAPYATSGTNTDSYLYTNSNWWLMSPGDVYNRGIYVYEIANTGLMRLYTTSQSIGTRPVINLLPTVTVSGGTGTYNNPYVVNGIGS